MFQNLLDLLDDSTEWPFYITWQVLAIKPEQLRNSMRISNTTHNYKYSQSSPIQEHSHEKSRIREDRQDFMFQRTDYLPKQYPTSVFTETVHHCRRCSCGLPSVPLATKNSLVHLGGGSPSLSSADCCQLASAPNLYMESLVK